MAHKTGIEANLVVADGTGAALMLCRSNLEK